MPTGNDFDYDAALTKLVRLRYEARATGKRMTPEIQKFEREIYAYLKAKREKSLESTAKDNAKTA